MEQFNLTEQAGPDVRVPSQIDWSVRQQRAQVAFCLDGEGVPVNPVQPNLPEGRGGLWHWGEAVAVDAVVFAVDATGKRRVLMVERADGGGFALPGGFIDPNESASEAVARELFEETLLAQSPSVFTMRQAQYVPDPRAGRAAWVVSIPGTVTLSCDTPPVVEGCDDARRAVWLPANTFAELEQAVTELGGTIYRAHVELLRQELFDFPSWSDLHIRFVNVTSDDQDWICDIAVDRMGLELVLGESQPVGVPSMTITGPSARSRLTATFGPSTVLFHSGAAYSVEAVLRLAAANRY